MSPSAAQPTLLDRQQRAVVEHAQGPMLVLGGPGTGKTTALVERFVALARATTPDRVLLLVPNRAQKIALQDLLTERLLGDQGLAALVEVPVYTWHGLAYHLVTRHYKRLGYPAPPVLLTSPEQWGDIREALAREPEVNWPHYAPLLGSAGFVDEIVDFCIRAEQRLLDDDQLRALVAAKPEFAEVVRFFTKHRRHLRAGSRVDYPTLLEDATWLLANHDDVRAQLEERFTHVLVDEGQELALVQQRMLSFLAGGSGGRSLVVAADPDSAIEAFRGAEPGWLASFEQVFGAHDTVVLPTSYRLGEHLGGAALSFIARSGQADHRPQRFAGASELEVRRFANLAAELDAVARALRLAHLREGIAYEDMAVLLTMPAAMLPPLERALRALEVPYSISVPDRPLEREPAVRSFRDLARVAFDRSGEALADLLRSPLSGLDDRAVRTLERAARLEEIPLDEVLDRPPSRLAPEIAARLEHLRELRDALAAKQHERADEAFWAVWERAAHYRELEQRALADLNDPANRELDALIAFARALGRFVERRRGTGTLPEYLQAIARADFGADPWLPPERARGGVQIMSFHAAKGRGWEVVAVCGCVDGAIPKGRRARGLFDPYFLDEDSPVERARRADAEDRRVFFVALTRAARRCIVTTSPGPTRHGRPSRYLEELVGELPETEGTPGLPPLTFAEAAARHRRVLADTSAPAGARLAALGALARICELDPACSAAQPSEWWWRWDWTEGALPIRAQAGGADGELPPGKLRTSYSRISKYDNCPLSYLYSVVLGLDPDTSHNMAFGSLIHQIFEDIEKEPTEQQKAAGRRRLTNREAVMARYEELFRQIEDVFPTRVLAARFKREGEVMIERYIDFLEPGRAALVEHGFSVDLQGHRLTGRIDRVDVKGNGVVVTDYKTSRTPLNYDQARESLQLAIYYLAVKQDPELRALGPPIDMRLVYPGAPLSHGRIAVRCQRPEEAEEALERLPVLIDGVLAEDFRPKPDADCTWCRFKPLCPLWPEGKEVPA